MDDGFRRVDEDLRAQRSEMSARFDAMQRSFDTSFDSMQRSLDAIHQMIIQVGGGMLAAFSAALVGLVATQL
jgi:hypothetical protein